MCKIFHRLALRKYFSLATLPLCRRHCDVTHCTLPVIKTNHKMKDVMLPKKLEAALSEEKWEYVVSF